MKWLNPKVLKMSKSTLRGSCSQMFFKIGGLKNFANFTGNTCFGVFFNKVEGLRESFNTGVFIWNLRNTFFYRTPPVAASEHFCEISNIKANFISCLLILFKNFDSFSFHTIIIHYSFMGDRIHCKKLSKRC